MVDGHFKIPRLIDYVVTLYYYWLQEHVSANLGLIEQTRDPVIEREESRLRCLEKGVRVFVDNVKVYMEEVKVSLYSLTGCF